MEGTSNANPGISLGETTKNFSQDSHIRLRSELGISRLRSRNINHPAENFINVSRVSIMYVPHIPKKS